jgi:hypothetical protein
MNSLERLLNKSSEIAQFVIDNTPENDGMVYLAMMLNITYAFRSQNKPKELYLQTCEDMWELVSMIENKKEETNERIN